MGWIGSVIGGVFDVVTEPVKEWQRRKTLEKEHQFELEKKDFEIKMKRAESSVELAKRGIKVEADWDMKALENQQNSKKDEYLIFILTLPFIGSFIPTVQDYVRDGWHYVGTAPMWYTFSFIGIIAASFGLRWLFSNKVEKLTKIKKG